MLDEPYNIIIRPSTTFSQNIFPTRSSELLCSKCNHKLSTLRLVFQFEIITPYERCKI